MRFLIQMVLFFLFCLTANAQQFTAITHVNIVDVKNGKIIADRTVLMKGNRIEKIGAELKIPHTALVISGKDKYLIPGLWDMHFHNMDDVSAEITDSALIPLLIANGITGVRDMFGLEVTLKRRDSIRAGILIGPETFVGALIDGPQPMQPFSLPVKNAARGVFMVDSLKNRGYDFIKVYSLLPRETYFAIAAESKKQHIPFEGHVPQTVSPVEAALAGQKSLEHQHGMLLQCSSLPDSVKNKDRNIQVMMSIAGGKAMDEKLGRLVNSFDTALFNKAADIFVQTGVWYCPTLITMQEIFHRLKNVKAEIANDSLTPYLVMAVRREWEQMAMFTNGANKDWSVRLKEDALLKRMAKAAYDKKVNMLAGDDNNNPFCYAGFSLHQELQQMVQLGIPDAEVLKMATYNPAVFFNMEDKFGTIEPGKIASLVLLDANPLTDISNTKKINAVLIRGRYINRNALDNLLDGVKNYSKTH